MPPVVAYKYADARGTQADHQVAAASFHAVFDTASGAPRCAVRPPSPQPYARHRRAARAACCTLPATQERTAAVPLAHASMSSVAWSTLSLGSHSEV